MRLLVVGAGSTGGYFGGRLTEAGRDVTFLVRPARAAQLRKQGLRIISPHGSAVLKPKIVTAAEINEFYEAVLLTVKGFQLQAALDDIAPAIGPETMILPVLNGMQHLDVLARRFSSSNLVGCALKVATILENDGSIVQLNTLQDLAYGELNGRTTPRITALDEFMKGAPIGARLSSVIYREMWEKWALLAALGAATCLMRGTVGEIEVIHGSTDFVLALLDEIITIIKTVGEAPSSDFVKTTRQQLTAKGSPLVSSMFRDLQRGRHVEVEEILGDLVRRGAEADLKTPLLLAATIHLRIYQNKVAASR